MQQSSSSSAGTSPWNIANAVTAVRIVLVPVLLVVLFADGGHSVPWRWAAAVLFVAIATTDKVDGYLARSRGIVTDLGKLLDPVADKSLVAAALISLAILGDLPWWVVIVLLVREVAVTVMRLVLVRVAVIPASRGGKIKTVLQVMAITGFLLPLSDLPIFLTWVAWILMGAALVITVVTGVAYGVEGWRLATSHRSAGHDGSAESGR